jgi:hypothetical protein
MMPLTWTFFLLSLLQPPQAFEAKHKPHASSQFSILNVTIGSDSLATLQTNLGKANKCRSKDYDKENLVFEFGEIGGGDVTAFYLSRSSRATPCALSPFSPRTLTTKGGIHLGMLAQDFARTFGPPDSRTAWGQWKYEWTSEVQYTDAEKETALAAGHAVPAETYEVGITIEAEFADGFLQYFYISRLATT